MQLFTHCSQQGRLCEDCPSPSPRCQRRLGELVSYKQGRGPQGRAEVEKQQRSKQQDASWEVTKARDCGEEDPKDEAGAACSCLGTQPVPPRFPSITMNPERGNLPPLSVTRLVVLGISAISCPGVIPLRPLWAVRKQELPRIKPRRQHATSPYIQGKEKEGGQEGQS